MKNLPNILSVSRILISSALFFLGSHPTLFTVLYLYCGISDIADGFIARRWKVESKIGAKLDSIGDVILYTLITVVFLTNTSLKKESWFLWFVLVIFVLKILNLILTKIRFLEWNIIHTIGNKMSGLLIYFMLPVYILFPQSSPIIGLIIVSLVVLAAIEETIIILTAKHYDPNRKSIVFEKRSK